MKICNWPDGCERPTRANGKCASHNVMWQRKHERRGAPKRRGPKAERMSADVAAVVVQRPSARLLIGFLSDASCSLDVLVSRSGMGRTTVLTALRALEAAGLKIQRTVNPENGREVLRGVDEAEAQRFLKAIQEVGT